MAPNMRNVTPAQLPERPHSSLSNMTPREFLAKCVHNRQRLGSFELMTAPRSAPLHTASTRGITGSGPNLLVMASWGACQPANSCFTALQAAGIEFNVNIAKSIRSHITGKIDRDKELSQERNAIMKKLSVCHFVRRVSLGPSGMWRPLWETVAGNYTKRKKQIVI